MARRRLFGLDFVDAPQLDDVLESILDRAPDGGHRRHSRDGSSLPVVLTPNVDILVRLDAAAGSEEAGVYERAEYVLPDGMPIVVASRLLGRPLGSRLTGSGLFELLWPRLARSGRPAVVLCSSREIADALQEEHGAAAVHVPPMIDVRSAPDVEAVVDDLDDLVGTTGADYVLLGLGHPKDAIIAARLHRRWALEGGPRPLCLGLGGSFAMYTGVVRRAPAWMQRAGLEWLFRFGQEPRRLFHRYFVRDLAFVGLVIRELRAARGRPKRVTRRAEATSR